MDDQAKTPETPKSALEIALKQAREPSLVEQVKKAGQSDLCKHLPLSKQLQDLVQKGAAVASVQDASKRNQIVRDSLTETLKYTSLADQLRKIGTGRPSSIHALESRLREPYASGPSIQSVSDIGNAVRTARKMKGLTQQQFADLAGVGRRFLSELEAGKPTCEIGRVLKVAAAAGLHLMIASAGQPDE